MRRTGLAILMAAIAVLVAVPAPTWSEMPGARVQILLAQNDESESENPSPSSEDTSTKSPQNKTDKHDSTEIQLDKTSSDRSGGDSGKNKPGLAGETRDSSGSDPTMGTEKSSLWAGLVQWLPLLTLALILALAIFLPMNWLANQLKVLRRALEILHAKMQSEQSARQQYNPAEQVSPELQRRLGQMENDLRQLVSEAQKSAQTARLALEDRAAAPQLELLGSGFDLFARMVLEERALAAGGEAARSASQNRESAARELSQFNQAFKQTLLALRQQLEQSGPTKRERDVFNNLVSIHNKSKQAAAALQEEEAAALGAPRFAGAADGLTFQAWCQQATADPAVLERAAQDSRGLFACLVDEYSREAARRLLASLQAGPAPGSTGEATEHFRRWMLEELLPLDDYLLALEADLQDAYDVSASLRNTARNLRPAYDRVTEQLQLRRHAVRLNEDYFDPSRQQITNRIGQDEVVRKVERNGFSWNGRTLRKAEVWVG
jgi:hypothetical protein